MKVALINDIHFGFRNNDPVFIEIQSNFFNKFFIPYIKENKIEEVWMGGDVFDSRVSLYPQVIQLALSVIKDLSLICKVKILLGNHDIQFKNRLDVHSLSMFDSFAEIIEETEMRTIGGKQVCFVPWLALKEQKDDFIKRIKKERCDVCYGHFEINGFEMSKGYIEENGFDQNSFTKCKHVYSGHFHIRNKIGNIMYIGSPYQMNFGDAQTWRGFEVIDLNTLKSNFVRNKISPKFKKVKYSEVKTKDLRKDKFKGNFIKIFFDEEVSENEVNKYTETVEHFDVIKLDVEVNTNQYLTIDDEEHLEKKDLSNIVEFIEGYVDLLDDMPDEIDKKILIRKIQEIHKQQ